MADEDEDDERTQQPGAGGDVPWVAIIGFAASVVTVLGFLGFQNVGEIREWVASGPSTSAAPSVDRYAADTSETDDPGTTEDAETTEPSENAETTTAETTSDEDEPEHDPTDLDDEATDLTPFTAPALLTSSFTTERTRYALVASGAKPCTAALGMTDEVPTALTGYGCSTSVIGVYRIDDDTAGDDEQVVVTVQVVPFDTAADARGARSSIAANSRWDFGTWCPGSGSGQDVCSTGYSAARKHLFMRHDHRYLIGVSAVYANLSSTAAAEPWLTEAAAAAVSASGPRNHE
ncbi:MULTISPECIES: hypothetical protein [unclassified Saccharopolyspora]|uniref:hypothetical protein n=1 Tax=unclassified Saccharopolyspora TaxID=2646250 RepID=UPI001CD27376|nr:MULTISPECIES: hypothetical protein [unclassified Saccharopolyspora]MCA1189828.1 hypothetical protein [Saccharopolyspora sp. 6T]MCA1227609.1 hypothetical protein [Saccharopolyspora sp. 6M]MCA1281731.1 hypothetical protein [Saccharopolyspora sp. 7B]